MLRMSSAFARWSVATVATMGIVAAAGAEAPLPKFSPDGTASIPSFDLPPSALMSKESADVLRARAAMTLSSFKPDADITKARADFEKVMAPLVAITKQLYPANVVEQKMGGVRVRVVTPIGKPVDEKRVLIHVHGGAFQLCADACALAESIPVAATGGFKVISVDYRMAPEARHPAALEDITSVYRELLKSYRPTQIGIYGCSAGGVLTAQEAAWLPMQGLPQAGAIGIFGAGGLRFGVGDSAYLAGYIDGSFAPPAPKGEAAGPPLDRGYFAQADAKDPSFEPAFHPDVLAKYPPTLLITGTRAMDLSPAAFTNSQLLNAGVRSTLVVGEGQGHCYVVSSFLPESKQAFDLIARFFRENLK